MDWMIVSQGVKDYFMGPLGPLTVLFLALVLAWSSEVVLYLYEDIRDWWKARRRRSK